VKTRGLLFRAIVVAAAGILTLAVPPASAAPTECSTCLSSTDCSESTMLGFCLGRPCGQWWACWDASQSEEFCPCGMAYLVCDY
jgi:hypothetical protein